jgi:predicted molibdopterin-dependent oxidoreductase YjgC
MFSRQSSNQHDLVSISINDKEVKAMPDDTVAAAALCAGLTHTRTTPVLGAPRAPFCLMGVCFECLMIIDGLPNQRACMTKVKEGMRVSSQQGTGDVL